MDNKQYLILKETERELMAEIERLRATLESISKRDGGASDHCACFDCRDSSDEAKAALKGGDDGNE
jgi:hypothetical protein